MLLVGKGLWRPSTFNPLPGTETPSTGSGCSEPLLDLQFFSQKYSPHKVLLRTSAFSKTSCKWHRNKLETFSMSLSFLNDEELFYKINGRKKKIYRKQFLLLCRCKFVTLVIFPNPVLNAEHSFSIPKQCFLSRTSWTNLFEIKCPFSFWPEWETLMNKACLKCLLLVLTSTFVCSRIIPQKDKFEDWRLGTPF